MCSVSIPLLQRKHTTKLIFFFFVITAKVIKNLKFAIMIKKETSRCKNNCFRESIDMKNTWDPPI